MTLRRPEGWRLSRGAALTLALSGGLLARPALAFVPGPSWGPASPERRVAFLRDVDGARPSRLAAELGLWTASYRRDGRPGLLWSATPSRAPRNLDPEAAVARALELGAALSESLGVDPAGLTALDATELDGWTTVLVGQRHRGVSVRDAVLVVTFREGQLLSVRSELVAGLALDPTPRWHGARAASTEWAARHAEAARIGAPSLELWIPGEDAAEARLVWVTRVSAEAPRVEVELRHDATDGRLVAVDDQLRYAAAGRIGIRVERATIGDPETEFTLPHLALGARRTDGDGEVEAGRHGFGYESAWVRIRDQRGRPLERFTVDVALPYQRHVVEPSDRSHAHPFTHLHVVKDLAAELAPSVGWVTRSLTANVNLPDTCNAFWDGQTVNFYAAGGGCNDTGRIASIVYHEFGHGYHQSLTGRVVGSIGEGSGDYLSATLLREATVGRGFRTDGRGIRRIDVDKRYPNDVVNEVHQDGLIWAGAMWDLLELLVDKHGDVAGRRIADRLFVLGLTQGPGLTSAYPAVLAADDDDGDLSNGTPNACEINAAFDAHGLIDGGNIRHATAATVPFLRLEHAPPAELPGDPSGAAELVVTAAVGARCGDGATPSVRLHWRRRGESRFETVPAPGGRARLEGLRPGEVLEYWFEGEAGAGRARSGSPEAPHALRFGRPMVVLFREGFEAGVGGWSSGASRGDDDWAIGAPSARAFGPTEAPEGRAVAGTDLGLGLAAGDTDGRADPDTVRWIESPPIPVDGKIGLELRFSEHWSLEGTRRVFVNGRELWSARSAQPETSGGWRRRVLALDADGAKDVVLRFELETSAAHRFAGWAIDDVEVSGGWALVDIPEAPPPSAELLRRLEAPAPTPPGDAGEAGEAGDAGRPPSPRDGKDPFAGTTGTIVGGCRCAAPGASPGSAALLLAGVLGLARRRRRRR